jgi:hypothetical protein
MPRKIGLAIALIAILIGFYVGSPYWTLHQMRSAAQAGQGDKLAGYVDFPAVRESIKTQFLAAMTPHTKDAGKDGPFATFGNMLAATMMNGVVDTLVTPDGLVRIMEQGKLQRDTASAAAPPASTAPPATDTPSKPAKPLRIDREYEGLDVFKVTMFDPSNDKPITQLVLNRDGIFGWKLKALRLLYMEQAQ